jgi:putative spermidine/putrescine transport system ATP-binding protein
VSAGEVIAMWASSYVEFRDVNKSYDGKTLAVRDLNCTVRQGEFLTFLGPSGSGKTTALMMLAGFEAPSSGDIVLNGRSLAHTPPHKRNMGVVFQNYALFPHMTVAENIAFPLTVRRMWKQGAKDKVERMLELVGLTGYGDRRVTQLSGGQQQRVALARALIFDPALVLMDEPLGALDKQLRERLQLEIKQIQKKLGVTVVYVTHDQSEALTMSDRIAVFNEGGIAQMASPEDLYERPESAFVAGFIGENNRMDGVLVSREGDACVVRTDDGLMVHALGVGKLAPSDRVTLSVRPEQVVLRPEGEGNTNVFAARVEEMIYHGDHTRVRLRMPSGLELFAKDHRHAAAVSPGQTVPVGWSPANCRAFPAQTRSAKS